MIASRMENGRIRLEWNPQHGERLMAPNGHYLPCEQCGTICVVLLAIDQTLCKLCYERGYHLLDQLA